MPQITVETPLVNEATDPVLTDLAELLLAEVTTVDAAYTPPNTWDSVRRKRIRQAQRRRR